MARIFLLNFLLQEAYALDCIESQRQKNCSQRRRMSFLYRDFINNYRLTEELIDDLLNEIKHLLKSPRRRKRGLSNKVKLLCTLSFLARGSYQKICGTSIYSVISQPSASRCLHAVVDALSHPSIVKTYIRFPQNIQERLKIKERFIEKYKIPNVIGCIDGTYVAIIRPAENEEKYYCRKRNHARNVQLITDADLNILHVDTNYGGATHDNFIFTNSTIRDQLEQLVNAGESVHLLGDSEYDQQAYLMVPIPDPEPGSPEEHYNNLHATARKSIENAIGILKARFRCLLVNKVLHYHPDMVAKIVIACCVLHNFCNRAGLPAPTLELEDQRREELFRTTSRQDSDCEATYSAVGWVRRQELIDAIWRARDS